MTNHTTPTPAATVEEKSDLELRVVELETQLAQAEDKYRRALADYHNVVRRAQEEKGRIIKLAAQEVLSDLVQPLDHLSLAAAQLKDKGLTMVLNQIWQVLNKHGLHEINPEGETFDPATMEAIETSGEGEVVVNVAAKGYQLNGETIRVAKVVVGSRS